MARDTLDFEEPIAVLLREIDALQRLRRTEKREQDIASLRQRVEVARRDIFGRLTPWQQVQVARHPSRPHTLDYVDRLFTDFVELHGDRRFGDDPAVIAGFARWEGEEILVVGHQKGRGTRENIRRNFGYGRPEGYRKALRVMQIAAKFGRAIVVFVDTPAAYPGIDSEERGVAEAIAHNLREMTMLSVPTIVMVTGEGGSGGALGLAIGDRILMQQYAVYGVIPPEGCAAILWRDAGKKVEAAEALKMCPDDLMAMDVIDEVVPEPIGGAHTDPAAAADLLRGPLRAALKEVGALPTEIRLEQRYKRFRRIGDVGFEDLGSTS